MNEKKTGKKNNLMRNAGGNTSKHANTQKEKSNNGRPVDKVTLIFEKFDTNKVLKQYIFDFINMMEV